MLEKCSVGIQAGGLENLTKVVRGFPQSVEANHVIVPRIGHDHFLKNLSNISFTNHPSANSL
jgi:hypothetical protein